LYGIIDDLFKSLFVQLELPWKVVKYEKKIFRLSWSFMIYFNDKYNTNTIRKIKEKLNNYLIYFNRADAKNFDFFDWNENKYTGDMIYDLLINH